MIKGLINAPNPGIGHQAMRGLQADHPAPGGWDPNRPPLIATDGHVDVIIVEGRRRAPRRASSEVLETVGIEGWPIGAGIAGAGEGKIVHVEHGHNLGPGI